MLGTASAPAQAPIFRGFLFAVTKKQQNEHDQRDRQDRFLEVYERVGTISAGARAAGVDRRTAKRWIERDAAFRERFEEAQAKFKDYVKEHLIEQAERGNGPTWRFIAKHELPDVYGDEPRQSAPKRGQEADAKWEELERAAESDDVA